MREVSLHEAEGDLAKLIRDAHDEEVVITDRGAPVAKLVPLGPKFAPRIFGSARAAYEVSGLSEDDIDRALAPMTEEEMAAEGWPT